MDEVWVCGACRSINQRRAGRCYRCRTPRELSSVDPDQLVVAGAGSAPAVDPAAPVGTYRDSGLLATLAQGLISGATILGVAATVFGADAIDRILRDGAGAVDETRLGAMAVLRLGALGVGLAALVAWSAWLSRVVANAPAVGLGWPNVSPRSAFLENFIPIVNVLRVPAILRDVMGRLEPNGGRGDSLLVAAWLGLVGGIALPRVGAFLVGFVATSEEDLIRGSVVVAELAIGLTVVGAIFLVAIIRWIETRMEARSTTTREPGSAASPTDPAPA